MPDSRSHRGAHEQDAVLFAPERVPVLRGATYELSWLLGRGYSDVAALALVGDRHQLTLRQRTAIRRAACGEAERVARRARRVELGGPLAIDGFNCLITIEAVLSAAPIFVGRDGAWRDLASVHGTYRKVEETLPALEALRETLELHAVPSAHFYLDRPVGNSGRLRVLAEQVFAESTCALTVSLHDAVDPQIVKESCAVASSDSWILDRAQSWVDLPCTVARGAAPWLVDLSSATDSG